MLRTLAFATMLLLALPTHAQDSQKGLDAFNSGEYATALREWRPLAEAGGDVAQYNLGFMYEYGKGVVQDYAEAVKWYRLAAEQGLANAQLNLGFMYNDGRGVPQDYAEAVSWYWLAAEQDDAVAQNNLGFMYNNGRGVARDTVLAQMWFYVAAAMGDFDAVKTMKVTAGKLTPAQIAEAQRLAREWLEAHQ